ncbi:MAG: hypothetical protein QOJ47_1595 [Gaiellales bacterium]|nr:hypothetical protein [Gaiellales bacterium]
MADRREIVDIVDALEQRRFPTVTVWNRLEGRPRSADFSRSLRAEVRDPLWMLSRQWQLGEFDADDAGSPVSTSFRLDTSRLTAYQPGSSPAVPFPETVPLEATVERRKLPLVAESTLGLDLRLVLGRRWLALIKNIGNYRDGFCTRYPIAPPDPGDRADAAICAHAESWAAVAAVAGRAVDGGALYDHLTADPSNHAYDDVQVDAGDRQALDDAAEQFVAWFRELILQPPADDAWQPPRLEYRFACSAPVGQGARVLVGESFEGGRLDWHSVDLSPQTAELATGAADPQQTISRAGVPTAVTFDGMPNARYWTFEDGRTNLGDVSASTTDLATLLLCEFALVYGNDWFLLPCDLPVGSLALVRGLSVTTVFGERFWIEAAGSGMADDWQRFSLFTLDNTYPGLAADTGFALLPTAQAVQQGEPLEQVALIRDEMANMVWGVERVVPLAHGAGARGAEAARELAAYYQLLLDRRLATTTPPPPQPPTAPIRYEVMTGVPEHWIPFVPVHVDGDNREIQLQRGAMPRLLDGDSDPPVPVRPLTGILREGLDRTPPEPYLVHEEEVPRAGVLVTQRFRRTRWHDGRVVVWYAAQRATGRGEGSSGLAFDRIADSDAR